MARKQVEKSKIKKVTPDGKYELFSLRDKDTFYLRLTNRSKSASITLSKKELHLLRNFLVGDLETMPSNRKATLLLSTIIKDGKHENNASCEFVDFENRKGKQILVNREVITEGSY